MISSSLETMVRPTLGNDVPERFEPPEEEFSTNALLSDEPTIELVIKAQSGDRNAVEALL